MSIYTNKVAVITGAGSGIGRALAEQLAAEGAHLALSDVNGAALDVTLQRLPAGTQVRGYTLDVSDSAAVFAHAEQVKSDFAAVHYVFNNAGTTVVGTFDQLDLDEIEWLLGINLWGVIHGCKAFLPLMLAQHEGCLVNISSAFGLIAFPMQSAYNISKFGVRALTECLWQELEGSGVRAVSVHPGGIKTGIGNTARQGRRVPPIDDELMLQSEKLLITPPEQCAREILDGIRRGKRRILPGHRASFMAWLPRLFPASYPRVIALLTKLA